MTPSRNGRKTALVVAYYFPPLAASGTFRTLKYVKYLHDCGWDALVVTVDPKWEHLEPQDPALLAQLPSSVQVINTYAFHVTRFLSRRAKPATPAATAPASPDAVAAPPRRPKRMAGLRRQLVDALNYVARSGWYPFAVWAAWRAMRKQRVDIIYTSGPPFAASAVGVTLKLLTGTPLVSDFRDPWILNAYHGTGPAGLERISRFLERKTFQYSDRVINTSHGHEANAKMRAAAQLHEKFIVIPNGFDPDDFADVQVSSHGDEFRISYAGSFYRGSREPFKFLEALAIVRVRDPETFDRIRAHFVGEPGWAEQHRTWLDGLALGDRVAFHPFQAHRQALQFLRDSDLLLMLGSVNEADTGTLPAKLFEYVAARKPILALVHDGESARFVRASGVGAVARPDDAEEIAAQVIGLCRAIRSGEFANTVNQEYLLRYDRRNLARQLAHIFDDVLTPPGVAAHDNAC